MFACYAMNSASANARAQSRRHQQKSQRCRQNSTWTGRPLPPIRIFSMRSVIGWRKSRASITPYVRHRPPMRESSGIPGVLGQSQSRRASGGGIQSGSSQQADGEVLDSGIHHNPILDRSGKPCKVIRVRHRHHRAQRCAAWKTPARWRPSCHAQAVIGFNLDGTIITANENFLERDRLLARRDPGQAPRHVRGAGRSRQRAPIANSGRSSTAANSRPAEYKRIGKGGRRSGSRRPTIRFSTTPASRSRWSNSPPMSPSKKLKTADFAGQIEAIGKSQAVIEFNLDGIVIDANENFLGDARLFAGRDQGKHHSMFVEPGEHARARPIARLLGGRSNRGEFQSGGVQARRQGRQGGLDSGFPTIRSAI